MASDDFFRLVRTWLSVYLPRSRRLSPHTIRSYKTALNTLLTYLREVRGLDLAQVSFDAIDRATISGFTVWLLDTQHLSASSVNQRLAAIKSFLSYCAQGSGAGGDLAEYQTGPARSRRGPRSRRAKRARS
jgi:integrase/recombinase XerD